MILFIKFDQNFKKENHIFEIQGNEYIVLSWSI